MFFLDSFALCPGASVFIICFKVLLLGAVLETIAKENLLVATQAAGDTLLKGSRHRYYN